MEKNLRRSDLIGNPKIKKNMSLDDLIELYDEIYGFMSGHLYSAIEIIRSTKKPDIRVISFTANLVSTGLRSIFAQLIREKIFNVVVTTCGTIDHDIARARGARYYKGSFLVDDAKLYEEGFHRLGNIYIPIEDYGPKVEELIMEAADSASSMKNVWGVYEFLWHIGSLIDDEHSILRAAYETNTPIFVPGWPDGAFGTSIFMARQKGMVIDLDYFVDMRKLSSIFFVEGKTSFGLLVGGGISKHHTIWWSQFMNGLDKAIYLTTAVEYDGSLSGAHPREAVTWGKIKPKGSKVVVYGDATVILPIISYILLNEWSD